MNRRTLALLVCLAAACAPADRPVTNDLAALRGALPVDPLAWRVIAAESDPAAATMATLFGDDAAVAAARGATPYPPDAALALVTWQRQDDANWYGGWIPARVISVELVRGDGYERWEGSPLQAAQTDAATAAARRRQIVDRPALRFP
jgi:hypothetical protein